MKKDRQARPRFLLVTNPSIPRRQGVTLEPMNALTLELGDPELLNCVRVRQSARPGYVVLSGCSRITAAGEYQDVILTVETTDDIAYDHAVMFVARMVGLNGVKDERPHRLGLAVVPGGLLS